MNPCKRIAFLTLLLVGFTVSSASAQTVPPQADPAQLFPLQPTPAKAAPAKPVSTKPGVFTLEQAVTRAIQSNPGLEAKVLKLEEASMNVGVAQSYFWPRLSYVYSRNKLENSGAIGSTDDLSSKSNSKGFRGSMSLFAGFSHLNNLQRSWLSKDMEEARHRLAKLELETNVQLQFLQLLKAREDLRSVQDSRKRIDTQLQAAQAFVKVGMAPYLNVLQNEVELSKVKQQEIRVANNIRTCEVQLNRYLNYDPNINNDYRGDLKSFSGVVGYTEEQAIKTALYSRPDLVIAQKSIAVAFKDSEITLGQTLPKVDMSYDNMKYHKDYKDTRYKDYTREYWAVGMNVTWDLFTGGSTTFTYLGDRKRAQSLQKEYEETMSSARADVIRALLDIRAAQELIAVSRKGVEAATESYDMANKRYMTHTGTITDLLDAQMKLTQAEADASQALTEYHSARARFFYNIGQENVGLE